MFSSSNFVAEKLNTETENRLSDLKKVEYRSEKQKISEAFRLLRHSIGCGGWNLVSRFYAGSFFLPSFLGHILDTNEKNECFKVKTILKS